MLENTFSLNMISSLRTGPPPNTLKLQWVHLTKIRFGDIFLLWCNIDPMSTGLSCTFHDLFKDSPLDHILLMWFGGRPHSGRQGQQEGEDKGGC